MIYKIKKPLLSGFFVVSVIIVPLTKQQIRAIMEFYKNNARSYAESTFSSDFAEEIFHGMQSYIIENGKEKTILDIGCGSGRDALFLTNKGYKIKAFDQSIEMIEWARAQTSIDGLFNVGRAQSLTIEEPVDFAYSIACLLHLDNTQFDIAIDNILNNLNTNGKFYFLVKKGIGEETDSNGRYFNYFTKEKLSKIFDDKNIPLLLIEESPDLYRPETIWLKVLIQKK